MPDIQQPKIAILTAVVPVGPRQAKLDDQVFALHIGTAYLMGTGSIPELKTRRENDLLPWIWTNIPAITVLAARAKQDSDGEWEYSTFDTQILKHERPPAPTEHGIGALKAWVDPMAAFVMWNQNVIVDPDADDGSDDAQMLPHLKDQLAYLSTFPGGIPSQLRLVTYFKVKPKSGSFDLSEVEQFIATVCISRKEGENGTKKSIPIPGFEFLKPGAPEDTPEWTRGWKYQREGTTEETSDVAFVQPLKVRSRDPLVFNQEKRNGTLGPDPVDYWVRSEPVPPWAEVIEQLCHEAIDLFARSSEADRLVEHPDQLLAEDWALLRLMALGQFAQWRPPVDSSAEVPGVMDDLLTALLKPDVVGEKLLGVRKHRETIIQRLTDLHGQLSDPDTARSVWVTLLRDQLGMSEDDGTDLLQRASETPRFADRLLFAQVDYAINYGEPPTGDAGEPKHAWNDVKNSDEVRRVFGILEPGEPLREVYEWSVLAQRNAACAEYLKKFDWTAYDRTAIKAAEHVKSGLAKLLGMLPATMAEDPTFIPNLASAFRIPEAWYDECDPTDKHSFVKQFFEQQWSELDEAATPQAKPSGLTLQLDEVKKFEGDLDADVELWSNLAGVGFVIREDEKDKPWRIATAANVNLSGVHVRDGERGAEPVTRIEAKIAIQPHAVPGERAVTIIHGPDGKLERLEEDKVFQVRTAPSVQWVTPYVVVPGATVGPLTVHAHNTLFERHPDAYAFQFAHRIKVGDSTPGGDDCVELKALDIPDHAPEGPCALDVKIKDGAQYDAIRTPFRTLERAICIRSKPEPIRVKQGLVAFERDDLGETKEPVIEIVLTDDDARFGQKVEVVFTPSPGWPSGRTIETKEPEVSHDGKTVTVKTTCTIADHGVWDVLVRDIGQTPATERTAERAVFVKLPSEPFPATQNGDALIKAEPQWCYQGEGTGSEAGKTVVLTLAEPVANRKKLAFGALLKEPSVFPIRIPFRGELFYPFVTYNQRPLVGDSPLGDAVGGFFEVRDQGGALGADSLYDHRPVLLSNFDRLKLTRVHYGHDYLAGAFMIDTAGGMPAELTDGSPIKFRTDLETDDGKKKFDSDMNAVAERDDIIQAFKYRRRVPVGPVRAYRWLKPEERGERQPESPRPPDYGDWPEVPENVSPLAKEVELDRQTVWGKAHRDAGHEPVSDPGRDSPPLLLLHEKQTEVHFCVRPPTVEMEVLERWEDDADSRQLRDVWTEYLTRVVQRPGPDAPHDPQADESLDDGAVTAYAIVLEEWDAREEKWVAQKTMEVTTPKGTGDGISRHQSQPLIFRCGRSDREDGTAWVLERPESEGPDAGTIVVEVPVNAAKVLPEVHVGRLSVHPLVPEKFANAQTGKFPAGFFTESMVYRLDPSARKILKDKYYVLPPFRVLLETPNAKLPPAVEIYDRLEVVIPDGDKQALNVFLDREVDFDSQRLWRNVARCDLLMQEWRWQGRPIPGKTADLLDTAKSDPHIDTNTSVLLWEMEALADIHHPFDTTTYELPFPRRPAPSAKRPPLHTENFDSDRQAHYLRRAVRVYSRYEGLYGERSSSRLGQQEVPPLTEEGTRAVGTDASIESSIDKALFTGPGWRRKVIAYRGGRPKKPVVKAIVPLTESLPRTLGESAERPQSGALTPGQPALLAVFDETMFAVCGVTESIECRIETAHVVGKKNCIAGITRDTRNKRLYWCNYGNRRIQYYDLGTKDRGDLTDPDLRIPSGIALDEETDCLYWADAGSGEIRQMSLGNGKVTDFVTDLEEPSGLAIDRANRRLYWTESGSGAIRWKSLHDETPGVLLEDKEGKPSGLAIDSERERLYWTAPGSENVQYVSLPGGTPTVLVKGLERPAGIAVDAQGRVYVADSKTGKLHRISADGKEHTEFTPQGLVAPSGLAIDPDGPVLYWTDRGSDVVAAWKPDDEAFKTLTFGVTRAQEYGPDPILTKEPHSGHEVTIPPLTGPFGYTMDTGARQPLFRQSAYLIPPPESVRPWDFAKVSFRRKTGAAHIDGNGSGTPTTSADSPAAESWTKPVWVQFPPGVDFGLDPRRKEWITVTGDGRTWTIHVKLTTEAIAEAANIPSDSKKPPENFAYYLLVSREITDFRGQANHELPERLIKVPSERQTDRQPPAKVEWPRGGFIVRLLEVQFRPGALEENGQQDDSAEQLWRHLFEPKEAEGTRTDAPQEARARITRMSLGMKVDALVSAT